MPGQQQHMTSLPLRQSRSQSALQATRSLDQTASRQLRPQPSLPVLPATASSSGKNTGFRTIKSSKSVEHLGKQWDTLTPPLTANKTKKRPPPIEVASSVGIVKTEGGWIHAATDVPTQTSTPVVCWTADEQDREVSWASSKFPTPQPIAISGNGNTTPLAPFLVATPGSGYVLPSPSTPSQAPQAHTTSMSRVTREPAVVALEGPHTPRPSSRQSRFEEVFSPVDSPKHLASGRPLPKAKQYSNRVSKLCLSKPKNAPPTPRFGTPQQKRLPNFSHPLTHESSLKRVSLRQRVVNVRNNVDRLVYRAAEHKSAARALGLDYDPKVQYLRQGVPYGATKMDLRIAKEGREDQLLLKEVAKYSGSNSVHGLM